MTTPFAPQLKLLHQPERLNAFLSGDWRASPALVEISPTNMCPAKCSWCFYAGGHTRDHFPWPDLAGVIEDLDSMGVPAISWTGGGDPAVYPWIDSATQLAHACGIKQGMFTNGYKPLEHPERLDWIRLTVTDRLEIPAVAAEYARHTRTGVVVNLDWPTKKHVRRLAIAARDAGVHYFQLRPALARTAQQTLFVPPPYLQDLETDTFRIETTPYKWHDSQRDHGYPVCHGHRFSPFLWHNGDLSVCAYHQGRPEFVFGNVLEAGSFERVWYSERREQMLLEAVGVVPDCQVCCKNHEINKSLAHLAGDVPGPENVEFL